MNTNPITRFYQFKFLIIRAINNIHRYDFASENDGWKKLSDVPVYGDSMTNSVFDPYAFIYRDKFYLLVSERKNNGIDLIESKDGHIWGRVTDVLECTPYSWQAKVNRPSLVYHNGIWHLWYTGQSPNVSCIGHTTSITFLHFDASENPCIKADLKEEGISVMNPCVLWNDNKQCFQMWYAAGDNYEPDSLFYAESKDGDNWVKHPKPVLTKLPCHPWESAKVGGCDVKHKEDGTYEMYYIGYQNIDVARICYATSEDGIIWNRSDDNLLIGPSKNSFDSDATYKPSVLEVDGKLYMWYNGRKNNSEYIGLAIKQL